MSRSVAMRSLLVSTAPTNIVEFVDCDYQWRVSSDHAESFRSNAVDWLNPQENGKAHLVKRNSHRDVWHVTCGGREYFAKLYHPDGPAARSKQLLRGSTAIQEWQVGLYAAAHNIATVLPVATALRGFRGLGGPSLLVTEAVSGVEPLNEFWLKVHDDREKADALAISLARLIARAHQCGFNHCDMHPGNILCRSVGGQYEALFVDLHNVRTSKPVTLRAVVQNLAQLNQWFRRYSTRTQRRRFLKHYLGFRERFSQASPHARNYTIEPSQLDALLAVQAEHHGRKLWSKRDRRTRRSGRYFTKIRPASGWCGHALLTSKHPAPSAKAAMLTYQRKEWKQWLSDPLSWVDPRKTEIVKDSHTATICKAQLPTDPAPVTVIVKRTLARNIMKRITQLLGRSRNMRSWRMANMLLNRDIPVAQPLAVVERYALGCIRLDSVIFTDYIEGSSDLETFLTRDLAALSRHEQRSVKDRLLIAVSKLLNAFHERGFVHRDLKAPNLLINWEPPFKGTPMLTLIDMDGISHVRRVKPEQVLRAVARLCTSLLSSPACTRTDRLRFLQRHFCRPSMRCQSWKDLWRQIDDLVHSKQRQKENRRQWKLAHYGRE